LHLCSSEELFDNWETDKSAVGGVDGTCGYHIDHWVWTRDTPITTDAPTTVARPTSSPTSSSTTNPTSSPTSSPTPGTIVTTSSPTSSPTLSPNSNPTSNPTSSPTSSPDRPITKAFDWRILTHKSRANSGWAIDIAELNFYSETSCDENSKVIPNGIAIDSGNAGRGWQPEKAFDKSGSWGGRSDDNDEFWIGMVFDEMTTVRCMGVIQSSTSHFATEWTVQANVKGSWQEVWVKKDIGPSNNPIQISWVITTDAPSFAPTETLSSSPSKADDCTDILKKLKCNKNEACAFGKKKVKKCIPKDEIDCSKYPNLNKCVKGGVCKYVDNACVHKCGGLRKNKCKIMKKTNKNLKICVFKGVSNRCWKCNPKNCVP